ncbi:MAG: hypothetical protein ABIK68_17875 [bacterium]
MNPVSTHIPLPVPAIVSCLLDFNAVTGDGRIEPGDSLGPIPGGGTVDNLDKIKQPVDSWAPKVPGMAVKVTFDNGRVPGRETFGTKVSHRFFVDNAL